MTTNEATMARVAEIPIEEESATAENAPQTVHDSTVESPVVDTDELTTLVRRSPALAALRQQPHDRRDLEDRLGVSKPTVHRLTRTLGEMGLVERSAGMFSLTRLGEAVADVLTEFTDGIETAYRLAPLLETPQFRDSSLDVATVGDATVTTATADDPYRPMRRYCSLLETTETLYGLETTMFAPQHIETGLRRVRNGMNARLVLTPALAVRFRSVYPDRLDELLAHDGFAVRIHGDLPYGLAVFDDRTGVGDHSETTGALKAFVDTDAPAVRDWAKTTHESYWAEAERFET